MNKRVIRTDLVPGPIPVKHDLGTRYITVSVWDVNSGRLLSPSVVLDSNDPEHLLRVVFPTRTWLSEPFEGDREIDVVVIG